MGARSSDDEERNKMKLKLDEQGNVVVKDGKPVYVHDDGNEAPFDAPAAYRKIGELNGEAKRHRENYEAASEKLKSFDGIEDPAAARKAIETIKNYDQKKLVDAGEVETIKSEMKRGFDAKQKDLQGQIEKLQSDYYQEKVGGSFARSKFLTDRLAIPADLAQKAFGDAFKVENGQVVAYGRDGQKILSKTNPGEPADFEESFATLVDQYPNKDQILKASGATGGGATQSGVASLSNKISRAQFDSKAPMDQALYMNSGGQVTD